MDRRINEFKNKTREELEAILNDSNASESDIIIASVEIGHRDIKEGRFYTTEEVIRNLDEKNMARIC